jgi:AAA15 family ATPase/GTPase
MSEKFLKYVKENFPHCQVILTTHNTNLMTNRIMRPDCVFILTHDGKITALNKATTRELREGHNLEKLYMSGEFDG